MAKIPLSLGPDENPGAPQTPAAAPAPKTPLLGYFAVGFGVLGIIGPAIFFTPICLLFSLFALLRGQPLWAFAGLLLTVGGILGSPLLMGLIGFGTLYMTFDWHNLMQPVYDMFQHGTDI